MNGYTDFGLDKDIVRYLVLTQLVVIAFGAFAIRILSREKISGKGLLGNLVVIVFDGIGNALVPTWIVSLSKILKEPHAYLGLWYVVFVAVYFSQYLMIFFLWLFGDYKIEYYQFHWLPPVVELVGMDKSFWLHVLGWYMSFNILARISLKVIAVSNKAQLIDQALFREKGWTDLVEVEGGKEKVRLYEVRNMDFETVRLRVQAAIESKVVVNMHAAFEIACAQDIITIDTRADQINDFDFRFGKLDTVTVIDQKTGKPVEVSNVTWDKMPKPRNKMMLPMGMSGTDLIAHNLTVFPVLYITGKPRSGKSVQALAMVKSLAEATTNFQLILIEFIKGAIDYEYLAFDADEYERILPLKGTTEFAIAKANIRRNHNVIVIGEVSQFVRCVEMLDTELEFRKAYISAMGAQSMFELPEEDQLPILMVVFDEILAAIMKYKDALGDKNFDKAMSLLDALKLSGGFVGIVNCGVFHEITKDTVGKTRDMGMIYAFNVESHETQHIVKQQVDVQFGQGIGLCRDVKFSSSVRKYCVPMTTAFMAQRSITIASRSASPVTRQNNMARQLLLHAESTQIQVYAEIGQMRLEAIRNSTLRDLA